MGVTISLGSPERSPMPARMEATRIDRSKLLQSLLGVYEETVVTSSFPTGKEPVRHILSGIPCLPGAWSPSSVLSTLVP